MCAVSACMALPQEPDNDFVTFAIPVVVGSFCSLSIISLLHSVRC